MILFRRLLVFGLIGCLTQSCQQRRQDAPTQSTPPVASLSQTTYAVGDTAIVTLSQPLRQLAVSVNNQIVAVAQRDSNTLSVPVNSSQVGFVQLIVSGVTNSQAKSSDTLDLEIRSNLKPRKLAYQVVNTYPHNPNSFTQGLEFYKGVLYESTGLNGKSKILRTDLTTGAILESKDLDAQYFGEGITILQDRIYQLTWTSNQCFRYTMGFTIDRTFHYPTQGWGMTHKDTTLIVSDGTNRLFLYTPNFQPIGMVHVYDDKGGVWKLNELEYVNGTVFANVWETNRIVQIDLASGKVIAELNLEAIVPKNLPDPDANVLNGIAYQPTEKALYITGKNWPALFKLNVKDLFVPAPKTPTAL